MAIYGLDEYGTAFYGQNVTPAFDVGDFRARPIPGHWMLVRWDIPTGTWNNFRIVRGLYGFARDAEDGVILGEWTRSEVPTSLVDYGAPSPDVADPTIYELPPGRFVYYTILLETAENTWVISGGAIGLVTGSYEYEQALYHLLPEYWRERDSQLSTRYVTQNGVQVPDPSSVHREPLRRFLRLFGYEFDTIRAEYDSLLTLRDIDRTAGGVLPLLAHDLGAYSDISMDVTQTRRLLRHLVYLNKVKGTVPGVEGAVSAYTSWGASLAIGKNLLLQKDDGSFETSLGNWWPNANATIVRSNEQAFHGTHSLKMTASNTLSVTASNCDPANVVKEGVPVTEGVTYTVSLYSRAATTTRNFQVQAVFYDKVGTLVGSATTGGDATNSTTAWTRHAVSVAAPTGAVYLRMVAYLSSAAVGEVHYVDAAQVEAAAAVSAYEAPRKAILTLTPDRINLIPNPSYEVDLVGWQVSGSATLTRTTDAALVNSYSVKVAATGAGDVGVELA